MEVDVVATMLTADSTASVVSATTTGSAHPTHELISSVSPIHTGIWFFIRLLLTRNTRRIVEANAEAEKLLNFDDRFVAWSTK